MAGNRSILRPVRYFAAFAAGIVALSCAWASLDRVAIEAEGFEKGLAAFAAADSVKADYVVVTGGIGRVGKVELPPQVKRVIVVRDDDPPSSIAEQSLWRGVVRRMGHGLDVGVTERPNAIAPKDAPPLKDIDDLYRYDPELVPVLLKGANLEHGRLGEANDAAILDEISGLTPSHWGAPAKVWPSSSRSR